MTLQPGTRLGHYEITSLLGSGGMGEVYRAKDHKLGRDVAIKVLREELASDPERLRRFEQEARSASALNHPNIITIHDIGKHETTPYIAMEFVEGKTLREMLSEGALATKELLQLATQIAEGLAKAHSAGIIHRDLKPENLMVTCDGYVKILDFGLAKLRTPTSGPGSELATMTKEGTAQGTVMGTVGYMSPEQARGQPADYRSDQFSLGAILYEMVTGNRAFQRDSSVQTLSAIIEQEPASIAVIHPETPVQLRVIVERCIAKNPEERYDSTRDLARELKSVGETATPLPSELIAAQSQKRRTRRRIVAIAGGMAAVLALALTLNVGGLRDRLVGEAGPRIDSVAVLPLENLSGDPEQEFFADGMTEALIADLAKIEALKVISRTSAMRYKGTDKSLPVIARELNVDGIVEGSVLRAEGRVRVTAQLIEAATDQHIWVETYERDMRNILSLQSEVARSIAQEIRVKLTPQEDALLSSGAVVNPEAHEAYLRGRHFLHRGSQSKSNFDSALRYFEKAIELDSNYALPYVGIADVYRGLSGWWITPKQGYPEVKKWALKALEMDDSLAEAHLTLCRIKFKFEWDWTGAKQECERFWQLSPGSAMMHFDRGRWLTHEGRNKEAVPELERALEGDPLNLPLKVGVGREFFLLRIYQRSRTELLSALEFDPSLSWARIVLSWTYILEGEYDQGVNELRVALAVFDDQSADVLGNSYAESGFERAMCRLAQSLVQRSVPQPWMPHDIAWLYSLGGDVDQAIRWLETAYEERSDFMPLLNADPIWNPIRDDHRFQDLLRRMNFPE